MNGFGIRPASQVAVTAVDRIGEQSLAQVLPDQLEELDRLGHLERRKVAALKAADQGVLLLRREPHKGAVPKVTRSLAQKRDLS